MCLSLFFGLLLGALLARAAWRWRLCYGGGCGPGRAPWGRGRHGHRWGRWAHLAEGFERATGRRISLGELMRELELSQRQQEEAQPVLAQLREQLGQSPLRLRAALATVAAEPFERARAEAAAGELAPEPRRQLVDGLEHLHNILIPEQREILRTRLRPGGGPAIDLDDPSRPAYL